MPLFSGRIRENYGPSLEGVAGTVTMSGRFTTAAAANPAVFSTGPWAIVHSATGQYTVTFTELFNEVLFVDVQLGAATASAQRALEISASSSPGASPKTPASILIETQSTAGTAADLTGPVVNFTVKFRRGKLLK